MRRLRAKLLVGGLLSAAPLLLAQNKPPTSADSQPVLKVCAAENPPPCADTPPKAIHVPAARCSKEAKKGQIHGVVAMMAVVGTDGLIHEPSVVESLGFGLDEEALQNVTKWKLNPGEQSGKPVPVETRIEVKFSCG